MERMYAKNQLIHRIKTEFINAGAEKHIASLDIPVEFGLDVLVQMQLHKRTTVGVMVGILYRHFEHEAAPMQACADMLAVCVAKDLMDYSTLDQRFVVRPNLQISREAQMEIDQYQYPLPMVVKPEPIKDNKTTGYLTIKGSVILKNNHHDDDVVLEHLDRMNSIRLCMNPETVAHVQNQWSNLSKPKDGETFEDFKKRVKAFEKYDACSRDILHALFNLGNEFYLTHRYDKRGRTYSQGYHVNYQGPAGTDDGSETGPARGAARGLRGERPLAGPAGGKPQSHDGSVLGFDHG